MLVCSSAFSWTPGAGDVGRHTITYRATDALGQFVETTVTVNVVPSQVLSVRLTLFNSAGTRVARVLLRRRPDGSFVGSFPKLHPDVYLAIAEGYASTDGTGPVIATARGTATVKSHHTVILHLVWNSS